MILINKTGFPIHSFHRRGVFLHPGRNEIDDESLTSSEKAMVEAMIQAKAVEREKEESPSSPPKAKEETPSNSKLKKRVRRAKS